MARGQRFTDQVQVQVQNTDTGFSRGAASVLQKLQQFKGSTENLINVTQTIAGQEEAQGETDIGKKREAGLAEKILTGGVKTAAYNKALETSYLAGLSNDTREAIAGIEAENTSDINAFNEKVNGYINGALKEVDPSVRDRFAQFADSQITNARIRVHSNTIRKNKQQAVAESSLAIEDFGREAATLAREGNQIGSAEAIQNSFSIIDGLVASEDITVDKAASLKRGIEREASEQTLRLQIDGLVESEGVEAAFAKIEEIENKPAKGWTPDEWDTFTRSARADINRNLAKQRALESERQKLAFDQLAKYESAMSLGYEVSQVEKAKVEELVQGTNLKARYDLANETASFSVLSLDDRNRSLSDLQTGDLENVNKYASFLKANQEINKLASKDGYSLGVQQGIVEPLEFDQNDPESLKARAMQADMLSDHYGVSVSPLTDPEANNLSNSINEMTVPEKVSLALTLNEAPNVWGQISSKNQLAFTMAGATGDVNLMTEVFKGQELLRQKLVNAPPSKEYLPVFNDFIGDVYGMEDKKAVLEAAKAHYAATADDGGVFDSSKFEESISSVTGGIEEVNGFKIELPRGVTVSNFEDYIDSFTPGLINKMGGVIGFDDEQAAEIVKESRLKNIGTNKYIVMTGETQALFNKDGTPFIISYSDEGFADAKAEEYTRKRKMTLEAVDRLLTKDINL